MHPAPDPAWLSGCHKIQPSGAKHLGVLDFVGGQGDFISCVRGVGVEIHECHDRAACSRSHTGLVVVVRGVDGVEDCGGHRVLIEEQAQKLVPLRAVQWTCISVAIRTPGVKLQHRQQRVGRADQKPHPANASGSDGGPRVYPCTVSYN